MQLIAILISVLALVISGCAFWINRIYFSKKVLVSTTKLYVNPGEFAKADINKNVSVTFTAGKAWGFEICVLQKIIFDPCFKQDSGGAVGFFEIPKGNLKKYMV